MCNYKAHCSLCCQQYQNMCFSLCRCMRRSPWRSRTLVSGWDTTRVPEHTTCTVNTGTWLLPRLSLPAVSIPTVHGSIVKNSVHWVVSWPCVASCCFIEVVMVMNMWRIWRSVAWWVRLLARRAYQSMLEGEGSILARGVGFSPVICDND